jgi:hypothetical protein
VKRWIISTLLLFFVTLGFLSMGVLTVVPAELAEGSVTIEEREETDPKDPTRRVQTDGKKHRRSFCSIAAFIRSTLNTHPGNIHLLQAFLV